MIGLPGCGCGGYSGLCPNISFHCAEPDVQYSIGFNLCFNQNKISWWRNALWVHSVLMTVLISELNRLSTVLIKIFIVGRCFRRR